MAYQFHGRPHKGGGRRGRLCGGYLLSLQALLQDVLDGHVGRVVEPDRTCTSRFEPLGAKAFAQSQQPPGHTQAVLGPVVQKFAFDAYWTGWPNGADLTDNKTLIAVIAWLPATILALGRKKLRAAVVVGWIVMMGVFLIPHSLRGSEMDWSEGEIKTGGGVVAIDRNRPA